MKLMNNPGDETKMSKLTNTKQSLLKKNIPYVLLVLPGMIALFVYNYLPMFGIVLAFKEYNYRDGIFGSPWVGFDNFEYFFSSNSLWRLLRNTIGYNLVFMFLISCLAAGIIAVMLYEIQSKFLNKFYQTSMLLPNFVSWVIIAAIVSLFLNPESGFLNTFLTIIGIKPVQWYSEAKYWPFILFLVELWKSMGMASLYFYAALLGVDPELYEAAHLDGANRFKQHLYISIPEMLPMMCIILITRMGSILGGDFGLYYQIPMNSGAVYSTTDVLSTYIYRGLEEGTVGATTAVGLFQSVVGLILVLTTNSIVKKINPDSAMY